MTDLYLKAPTQEDMDAALLDAGVIDAEGNAKNGFSIDRIGPFSNVTGYDKDGEPIEQIYADWHTNLRGNFNEEQLALLAPLNVFPIIPYRVWA
jgi:hypothetical protein